MIRGQRRFHGGTTRHILLANFDIGAKVLYKGYLLLRQDMTEHHGRIPMRLKTDGREQITFYVFKRILTVVM